MSTPGSPTTGQRQLPPSHSLHSLLTPTPALLRSFPIPAPLKLAPSPLVSTKQQQSLSKEAVAALTSAALSAAVGTSGTLHTGKGAASSPSPSAGSLSPAAQAVFDDLKKVNDAVQERITRNVSRQLSEPSNKLPSPSIAQTAHKSQQNVALQATKAQDDGARPVSTKPAKRTRPEPKASAKLAKKEGSIRKTEEEEEELAVKGGGGGGGGSVKIEAEEEGEDSAEVRASLQLTEKMLNATPGAIITECVESKGFSPDALAALTNSLTNANSVSAREPFLGVAPDILSSFIASVVDFSSLSQSSQPDDYSRALHTVVCLAVISHPTFDTTLLPETVADDVIDGVAATLRAVQRHIVVVVDAAAEKDLEDVVEEQPVRNRRGRPPAGNASAAAKKKGEVTIAKRTAARVFGSLSKVLNCLKICLQRLTALGLSNRSILSNVHFFRIEELVATALQLPVHGHPPQFVSNRVAEYVIPPALALYHTVWLNVHQQQEELVESLLSRIQPSAGVSLRLYHLPFSHPPLKVAPITAAIVLSTQATPLPAATTTSAAAALVEGEAAASAPSPSSPHIKHLELARLWMMGLVAKFFTQREDKAEKEHSLLLVKTVAEDLIQMVALPAYPAVDIILRTLVSGLAHGYLRPPEAGGGPSFPGIDRLRCIAAEILGKAAQRITLLQSSLSKELTGDVVPYEGLLEQWRTVLAAEKAADSGAKDGGGRKPRRRGARKDEAAVLPELSMLQRLQCMMFHALAKQGVDAGSGTDGYALWQSARLFSLSAWAADTVNAAEKEGMRCPSFFGVLGKSDGTGSSGSPLLTDAEMVARFSVLQSMRHKSLLHSSSGEVLMHLVLGIFKAGCEDSSWDSARKQVMGHVAVLLESNAALVAPTWTIVRQAACDESPRVREASTQLLLTLLQRLEKHQSSQAEESERTTAMAHNVISALIHLMGDRIAAVAVKAVQTLGVLLPSSPILAKDSRLCLFVLSKLLELFSLQNHVAEKVRPDIELIFVRRWFIVETGDREDIMASVKADALAEGASSAKLAGELVALVTQDLALPFDVPDTHPLISLLRRITEDHLLSTRSRKIKEVGRLAGSAKQLFNKTVKALLQGVSLSSSQFDPAMALATINVLAAVSADWVVHTIPNIVSQFTTSPKNDTEAAALLHAVRIVRSVLQQSLSVEVGPVVAALANILNTYKGAYQFKVLLAAAAGMCAAIEPGRKIPTGTPTQETNLRAVYCLMNSYYYRTLCAVKEATSNATMDVQNVSYSLRHVFLLSEFLRLYPWGSPSLSLGTGDTDKFPNVLAKGPDGILGNVYNVLISLGNHCPASAKSKMTTMIVRAIGSLCMQQPTVYFRRSVEILRTALGSAEAALNIQALSVLVDFLTDEEAKVTAANAATSSSSSGGRLSGKIVDGKAVDHNSGMATWLLQQFCREVDSLASSESLQTRGMSLDVIELSVHQGLLSPLFFVEALVALSADVQCPVFRTRATKLLQSIVDRHDDAVFSKGSSSVRRCFDTVQKVVAVTNLQLDQQMIELEGVCGYFNATDVVPTTSVLTATYSAVGGSMGGRGGSKKRREQFVNGLLTQFAEEAKLVDFCKKRAASSVVVGAQWLNYLVHAVAFLPLTTEAEVLGILQQVATGVNLFGQASMDFLETAEDQSLAVAVANCLGAEEEPARLRLQVELGKVAGSIFLLLLKSYLKKEFGITPGKLAKRRAAAVTGTATNVYLPRREVNSKAANDFIKKCSHVIGTFEKSANALDERISDPAPPAKGKKKKATAGEKCLEEISGVLQDLLEDDSKDLIILVGANDGVIENNTPLRGRRGRDGTRGAKRGRRREHSAGSDDSETASDDESSSGDNASSVFLE